MIDRRALVKAITAVGGSRRLMSPTNGLIQMQPSFSLPGAVWLAPSGDTSGADDTSAINSEMTAGNHVELLPGIYYVNMPLVVPSGITLDSGCRAAGNPIADFGKGPLSLSGAVIQAVPGFSGASMIEMASSGSQAGGQLIARIALDGSHLPAGNSINCIGVSGAVADFTLDSVIIYKPGGDGVFFTSNADGNPDQVCMMNCEIHAAGGIGVHAAVGVADSTYFNNWVSASGGHNWSITNGGDTMYIRCRAENSSGGFGFNLISFTGFTGDVRFIGSRTTGNNSGGWSLSGAGTGTWYFDFCGANDAIPWKYSGAALVRTPPAYNTSTSSPTFD